MEALAFAEAEADDVPWPEAEVTNQPIPGIEESEEDQGGQSAARSICCPLNRLPVDLHPTFGEK